jgi:hypothetical protein
MFLKQVERKYRKELEEVVVRRLLEESKCHGVPEFEFGPGAGKQRRKVGSMYDTEE